MADQAGEAAQQARPSLAMLTRLKTIFGKAQRSSSSDALADLDNWRSLGRQAERPDVPTSAARSQRTTAHDSFDGHSFQAGPILKGNPDTRPVQEPDSYLPDQRGLCASPRQDRLDLEATQLQGTKSRSQCTGTVETNENDCNGVFSPRRCTHNAEDAAARSSLSPRSQGLTSLQKGVVKCAVAYLIASLFTFVPALSDFFAAPFDLEGPVSGAHVIATVATYYNPAKTLGAMVEADIFMLYGSFFAFLVCIGSMATASIMESAGLHTASHWILVIVWLMGSMGLVAWMKVKVSNAQFGSVRRVLWDALESRFGFHQTES